jgi:hypothetical protein
LRRRNIAICIPIIRWFRRAGLSRLGALHRDLRLAAAEGDGARRGPPRGRHVSRFPLLRPGLPAAGFVGPNLPEGFAAPAAYGDFATALLAILALLTVRLRFLFWPLIWAFNVVGIADLVMDTVNAVSMDLPSVAGQLGAGYAIPILYVPALFWTHLLAFFLLLRPARTPARSAGAPTPLAATE